MSEKPQVTLIGIYKPVIDAETWKEQAEIFGEEDTEEQPETRDHFRKLVLVEGFAEGVIGPMDFGEFAHLPKDSEEKGYCAQVGYEEALLDESGSLVINQGLDKVEGTGKLRFAAFVHEFDPSRPITWMGKPLPTLPVTEMPSRLAGVQYCAMS